MRHLSAVFTMVGLVMAACGVRAEVLVHETFDERPSGERWRISDSATVEGGMLHLPPDASATLQNLTTQGAVAIEFKAKMPTIEHPHPLLGLRFGTPDNPERYMLNVYPNGHMIFHDSQLDLEIFRALAYLDPVNSTAHVVLRWYPEGRRLTYDTDGHFYGERVLAGDEMADINELTGFKLWGDPGPTEWLEFKIERLEKDEPAPLYKPKRSAEPIMPAYPQTPEIVQKLTYLYADNLPGDEGLLATCLQGIINQDVAEIYLGYHRYVNIDTGEDWSRVLEARGHTFDRLETLDELVDRYRSEIKGVTLYDPLAWQPDKYPTVAHQINIATTAAGILHSVPVTPTQKAKYFPDAPVLLDLRNRWSNARDAYAWAWDEFWDRCNHNAIVHQENASYTVPSRDYFVAHKMFTFLSSDVRNEADYRFYMDMLAATTTNTPVIGMTVLQYGTRMPQAVFDEDTLFRLAGELGKFFVYIFSSGSLSVHSAVDIDRLQPKPLPPCPPLENDKVYIAFMCSEGENLTWAIDLRAIGFRNEDRKLVPKGFSLPGAIIDTSPAILQDYYEKATDNDAFFIDGSGVGDHYNPGMYGIRLEPQYRQAVQERFLHLTNVYLDRMGLSIVRPFDPTMSIRRSSLEQYVEHIPNLQAIFTGYNAERGLPPDAPMDFMIDDVPVFRTVISSGANRSDEENAALFVRQIRKKRFEQRPAFVNVFVLGNYVIHSSRVLKLVMDELGPGYVAVRPEHFAELYKQHQANR